MEIISKDFTEKLLDEINDEVVKTLRRIEKYYAVRARFLSKKHACIYADIAPPTLEKWLAKGLPVAKIDGCFRISADDIDEFVEKHKICEKRKGL